MTRPAHLTDDLSGPFQPDLQLGDLSRAALGRLGREWLLHGHMQDRVGVPMVMDLGADRELTQQVAIEEWMAASPIYSVRMQEALGFRTGDVPAILKNLQLDIGAPPEFMDFQLELIDEHHGEFHLPHCGALLDVEPMGDEWVQGMCHTIEDPTFDATGAATNRQVRFRPIHRPPRVPADRAPHCAWTIAIEPEHERLDDHANRALLEASVLGRLPITALADKASAEPGGLDDYRGPFDPDFQLEDLGHAALQVTLDEVALQSHLLFRGLLLSVAQRFGEDAPAKVGPRVLVGLAGLTADRLSGRNGMGGGTGSAEAIAKMLQLHPTFHPAAYVDRSVELVDEHRVRFAVLDSPIFHEADDLTWVAGMASPEGDRAVTAMAQAVDPRATATAAATSGDERVAWEIEVDPDAPPAREQPEVTLARFSGGSTFTFHRFKPTT